MAEPSRESRELVNRIFGDSIPDVTRDELEPTSPDDRSERDRWLRDNVPPHHD
ncbi:hypothetical protein ACAG24_006025 [Mycobacterium sp. pW049]|uniref:hypothetical protein n=1 Tax=[Mycobacterium] bulgaricum TaxID=3238985 RepID=UPI00351ADA3C